MTHAQGKKELMASEKRGLLSGSKHGSSSHSSTIVDSHHHDQKGHSILQGPSSHRVKPQTPASAALTHQYLAEHNQYHAHTDTTKGIDLQTTGYTTKVIQAGRSLNFDLSQPVYGETMCRYDGMTPAQRFLAEKDQAKFGRVVPQGFSKGCQRQRVPHA